MNDMTHEQANEIITVCSGCKREIKPDEDKFLNHLGRMHHPGCGSGRVTEVKRGMAQTFFNNQGGV